MTGIRARLILTLLVLLGVAGAVAPVSPADAAPVGVGAFDVDGGASHTCALKGGGVAECWGDDSAGQADPPSTPFSKIAAGGTFSCGILQDADIVDGGPLDCWGANTAGQATPPVGDDYIDVVAGVFHACARHYDWSVVCWGSNSSGRATPPADAFYQISAGTEHNCGIISGGNLKCWGNDSSGQVSGAPAGHFLMASVGDYHSCGIRQDDTVACWGFNPDHRADAPTGTYWDIASAGAYNCAITKPARTLSCWGASVSSPILSPPPGTYVAIASGWNHMCAIRTDAGVDCWGSNTAGQVRPILTSPGEDAYAAVALDLPLPTTHVGPTPAWIVTGHVPDGVTFATGKFTGTPTELGSFPLTFTSSGTVIPVEFQFTLSVHAGPLDHVQLSLSDSTPTEGQTVTFTVEGYDGAGNDLGDFTSVTSYSSDIAADSFPARADPAVANVAFGFDPAARVTTAATHTITVTYDPDPSYSFAVPVTVLPLVIGLDVDLSAHSVLVDASVIATVQGLDAGGTAVADLTPYSTFTSDRAADIVDVDEITFPQVGTSVITGSYGSLAATDSVAVTAGPVASLVVTTSASLVTENDSVTVTVMGYDAHGNPIGDVTSAATISSSVASDAIANPVVTFAFDAGNAATTPLGHVLTASLGAATGSATVTVEPLVHSITMHLSSSTATVGDTIAVTVEAFDVNGDPVGDISTDVVVTSDQPDLVSGNTVTFTHASPHRITATYGTLSASGIVQVSPALARLAATGAAVLPLLSAPLALLTLGGALLVLRRRRTSGI